MKAKELRVELNEHYRFFLDDMELENINGIDFTGDFKVGEPATIKVTMTFDKVTIVKRCNDSELVKEGVPNTPKPRMLLDKIIY